LDAAETARRTFEEGALDTGLPTFEIERARLAGGVPLATLAHLAGLTRSSGEARRLIQGGGLRVNDVAATDVKAMVDFTVATYASKQGENTSFIRTRKKSHLRTMAASLTCTYHFPTR